MNRLLKLILPMSFPLFNVATRKLRLSQVWLAFCVCGRHCSRLGPEELAPVEGMSHRAQAGRRVLRVEVLVSLSWGL